MSPSAATLPPASRTTALTAAAPSRKSERRGNCTRCYPPGPRYTAYASSSLSHFILTLRYGSFRLSFLFHSSRFVASLVFMSMAYLVYSTVGVPHSGGGVPNVKYCLIEGSRLIFIPGHECRSPVAPSGFNRPMSGYHLTQTALSGVLYCTSTTRSVTLTPDVFLILCQTQKEKNGAFVDSWESRAADRRLHLRLSTVSPTYWSFASWWNNTVLQYEYIIFTPRSFLHGMW